MSKEEKNKGTSIMALVAGLVISVVVFGGIRLFQGIIRSSGKSDKDVKTVRPTKIESSKSDKNVNAVRPTTVQSSKSDMILVPAGKYPMSFGKEKNNTVKLEGFYIDRSPVSVAEYQKYLKAVGKEPDNNDPLKKPVKNPQKTPITSITFAEAEAYAGWKGKRLPLEEEWEAATAGMEGNHFPWGNEWDAKRVPAPSMGLGETGLCPSGATPLGIEDMTGVVFHYTATKARLNEEQAYDVLHNVVRNGSFTYIPDYNRNDFRTLIKEGDSSYLIGFRCVKPLDPEKDLNMEKYGRKPKEVLSTEVNVKEPIRQLLVGSISPDRVLQKEILEALSRTQKGETVADVGCGTGVLTWPLSDLVGKEGTVYALDIDKDVVEFIKKVAQKTGRSNVRAKQNYVQNVLLKEKSCDRIFLYGTIHCFNDMDKLKDFLLSCRKSLKRSGKLVIVEFRGYDVNRKAFEMLPSLGFMKLEDENFTNELCGTYEKVR